MDENSRIASNLGDGAGSENIAGAASDSGSLEAQGEKLRVFGLVPDSIVDGPGLRYGLFVQGCTHHCPGCHNPESQAAEGGELYSIEDIHEDISANKLIRGVTFSGGEPFEQPVACAALAQRLKEDGYNIWAYSGYLLEDLLAKASDGTEEGQAMDAFLKSLDVLVDGPFVESLKSYELDWCGSSNQRLIDMQKTLSSGKVVLWSEPKPEFTIPESW